MMKRKLKQTFLEISRLPAKTSQQYDKNGTGEKQQ